MNNQKDTFIIVVETFKGSNMKYEMDKKLNKIRLDRILHGTNVYPGDYGYIDETLELDGDPVDVLILTSFPSFPGCLVSGKIVGALKMIDNNEVDTKLLAVNATDPAFKNVNNIEDIPTYLKEQVWDFFKNYKNVEHKSTDIKGWTNKKEALDILSACQKRYQTKK